MTKEKTVVLGITGGIAAYKVVEVARRLTQAGVRVRVVMTEAATEFVRPLTFQSVTYQEVTTEMFAPVRQWKIGHIGLAEAADAVIIAPASANTIAKLAHGLADNMLTATVLATKAPVILAPSMNDNMYLNPATQANLAMLKERGFIVLEPGTGALATGKRGVGRLPEPDAIIGRAFAVLGSGGDLAGKNFVVTAGGTEEPLDPVRHIGNRSSGKMGFAIAEAARDRGAEVTLITAPVSLADPAGISVVKVRRAAEMKTAVAKAVKKADALVMAAAVADYMPDETAKNKIKKQPGDMTLKLVRTPDILAEVKGKFVRVGFAAESENLIKRAKAKLAEKRLDLIVANDITEAGSGFDTDTNKVTLIDKGDKTEKLPLLSKRQAADRLLDRIVTLLP